MNCEKQTINSIKIPGHQTVVTLLLFDVSRCVPPWKVTSHYERERLVSYKQGQKERDFYHKIIRGKGPGDGLVWILITHLFFGRKSPPPMPLFCSLINDGEIAVHGRKYPLRKGPHPKWKETLSEQLEKRGIDNYLLARQQRHWLCKFSVRIKKTINNGKKRGNWLMVCTDMERIPGESESSGSLFGQ